MKRKKKHDGVNHERWLVSYADFITLLFAFFVVMFASSQVDKRRVGAIAASFQAYIRDGVSLQQDVTKPNRHAAEEIRPEDVPDQVQKAALKALSMGELAPVKSRLEQELAAEVEQGKVGLSLQPRGLVLSLRESALFPPGQDSFTPEALPVLGKIGAAIAKLPGQPVRLEGHTDDVPIETAQFPSNWELSAARAMAVLQFLAAKFQIEPERMAVAGYADHHPVAGNDTPQGRAQNRRVDIVVLSRSAAEMEPHQKPQEGASP